jgi:hypothetical protein
MFGSDERDGVRLQLFRVAQIVAFFVELGAARLVR